MSQDCSQRKKMGQYRVNGKEVRGSWEDYGKRGRRIHDSPHTQLSHILNPTSTAANLALLRTQPKNLILFANEFLPI